MYHFCPINTTAAFQIFKSKHQHPNIMSPHHFRSRVKWMYFYFLDLFNAYTIIISTQSATKNERSGAEKETKNLWKFNDILRFMRCHLIFWIGTRHRCDSQGNVLSVLQRSKGFNCINLINKPHANHRN